MTDQLELFTQKDDLVLREYLRDRRRQTISACVVFAMIGILMLFVTREIEVLLFVLVFAASFIWRYFTVRARIRENRFGQSEGDRDSLHGFLMAKGAVKVPDVSFD